MDETRRQGLQLRGILNDLKRRPADAARELGISEEEINGYIEGRKRLPLAIIERATEIWPVNHRDFFLIRDDCPKGVRIVRAAESEQSARVMERAGKAYYEYRDTAMSSVAQFRPEWIKELCEVQDNDPENPAVQWNNGHFMHQFTYFVGPVNFYYRGSTGEKQVAVMDTGDSMYITPFVPHSFAARNQKFDEGPYILALTYGDKLLEARQELAALGHELASAYPMDLDSREMGFGWLLRYQCQALSVSREELRNRTGIRGSRLGVLLAGRSTPTDLELAGLARALGVDVRDLLPPDAIEEKVIVNSYDRCRRWRYPDDTERYEMVELSGSRHLPHSHSLEINVDASDEAVPDLRVGLHQYGYVLGTRPVRLSWEFANERHSEDLQPGDSFYLKPYVKHAFSGAGAKVLNLRIGGRMAGEATLELSLLGRENLERITGEAFQWFDSKGKSRV